MEQLPLQLELPLSFLGVGTVDLDCKAKPVGLAREVTVRVVLFAWLLLAQLQLKRSGLELLSRWCCCPWIWRCWKVAVRSVVEFVTAGVIA